METPLYESEFGHGLDLHDAEVLATERRLDGGVEVGEAVFGLFDHPQGSRIEGPYRYGLVFVEPSSDFDRIVPGLEIDGFELRTGDADLEFEIRRYPNGERIAFRCRAIREGALASTEE